MKIEWDFKEFTDFADELDKFVQFEAEMKKACKELAEALLKLMKLYTPVDTSKLINGWNGNQFIVTSKPNGFEIKIVNTTPYASWVNDGHEAYNQYGGPYPIKPYNPMGAYGKPEGRIKVLSPYQWQRGNPTYYVFGHFFVERGILRLNNSEEVEKILMTYLNKWWENCLNG